MSQRINYEKISPEGVKSLGSIYAYIEQCGLDKTLMELVYLRVSQINGCAYCLDLHMRALLRKNLSPVKLSLVGLWGEAGPVFSEREKAAFAWAETVTRISETHVPDKAFQAASAVFTEKELVDMTLAIGLMNAYNRLAISFRRVPQEAVLTESCGTTL
ncbi:carboxymuconolactone decarboxylase family protein [Aristophania vespae]|uniref:Carboxymuconolactone decarboxylase family protein n=1 Tax=Aristophania vespae TaxID=2697033 RepID=A0A6P1NMY9_9PROT|nr:carboxymuconolactone decarboxylase family protein [Aristophania vespae]QHI96221.1 carboxymuconolactone decarboxylase family protein [Aristophania vespae]